jgi:hypothetical protein
MTNKFIPEMKDYFVIEENCDHEGETWVSFVDYEKNKEFYEILMQYETIFDESESFEFYPDKLNLDKHTLNRVACFAPDGYNKSVSVVNDEIDIEPLKKFIEENKDEEYYETDFLDYFYKQGWCLYD